jgi:hypothetical protein
MIEHDSISDVDLQRLIDCRQPSEGILQFPGNGLVACDGDSHARRRLGIGKFLNYSVIHRDQLFGALLDQRTDLLTLANHFGEELTRHSNFHLSFANIIRHAQVRMTNTATVGDAAQHLSRNNRVIVRAFESIGIGNFARRRKASGSARRNAQGRNTVAEARLTVATSLRRRGTLCCNDSGAPTQG